MLRFAHEPQKTADDDPLASPGIDEFVRSNVTERHRSSETRSTASRGQKQEVAAALRHRGLRTVVGWAANILIVGLLGATMVVWLTFLAWAGRHLLALL